MDKIDNRRAVNRLISKLGRAKASVASSIIIGLKKPVPELTGPFDILWCPRFPLQTHWPGARASLIAAVREQVCKSVAKVEGKMSGAEGVGQTMNGEDSGPTVDASS